MTDEAEDGAGLAPHQTTVLFGHADAEQTLLEAYRGGRMPHAWLIGGQPGIGKATLAYRLARFVLAHPDPASPAVQNATSLAVDPEHPAARRMAVKAQGDLLVLERVINPQTGKLFQNIRIDDVKRTVGFFGSTAGEGGWRIAIVDPIDDLQRDGANALLKILEEPPPRTLLLLVSQSPGRELPTIRSRCRRLLLRPLATEDVMRAVAAATGAADGDLRPAAEASGGSPGRALHLLDGPALALRGRVLDLMEQLPKPDPRALHALGDALSGTDPESLETFVDLVNGWLSDRLRTEIGAGQKNKAAMAWERINRAARDVEAYNLERKPLVFAVFKELADAARRS
ncbi:DNA polymerase III subunit delta' [Undibacter mobilis]|uniref:DNA polymerase III subunit delta n=1 Tax=Undibacter mobilis TaxID=2292256 RepID=A0A371B0S7_9BRAD|nr:DNA polymerase III subunit delta' [Undibacter mobilis]RDV01176.1 DNA polymerase III subunit delta' [Undibacter mobilis]